MRHICKIIKIKNMKNKLLFLKLFCTLVFLFSFEIQAQNLDQSNTTGSQAGFLVNNAGANIAQSFVAGITGPLSAFHIRVGDINSTYFSAGDFQLILHSLYMPCRVWQG